MCPDMNGNIVYSNPFMYKTLTTDGLRSPNLMVLTEWEATGYFREQTDIASHVYLKGSGTVTTTRVMNDAYTTGKVLRLNPYAYPNCAWRLGTPSAVVGTTNATGYDSSISVTIDTSTLIDPAVIGYIDCYPFYINTWGWNFTPYTIQVPIQILASADCSVPSWFLFESQPKNNQYDFYPAAVAVENT